MNYDSLDDAAVYHLKDGRILIESVDFFTPIVDDPFLFGSIAAVNALSDIYAMGGIPLFALNITGFPSETLPLSVLADILKGAESVADEVGIPVLGGHSIKDKEPKFGWVVTGEAGPGGIIRNSTARPGDILILTKPLGSGILTTAIKRELADDILIDGVVELMQTLNKNAADAMIKAGVSACTDITGYGLLGHLAEMCEASHVSAVLDYTQIPFMEGVFELAAKGVVPGGSKKNLAFVNPKVAFEADLAPFQQIMLADAQTSGGLLIAVSPDSATKLLDELKKNCRYSPAVLGKLYRSAEKKIYIK